MKRSLEQSKKKARKTCEFLQQDRRGHWQCRLLQSCGQPIAIIAPHGRIEWATTSAHQLLQRYWPAHTGLEDRVPHQIRQWMIMHRKRRGARDTSPEKLAPLVINRPPSCLIVRSMPDGTFAALLFEEHLFELPADRLVSLGLTPREAEVLRWLAQGKSSHEIAIILGISPRTVSKHLTRVYLQLGVENRYAAVSSAMLAMRGGELWGSANQQKQD
jgi:DNA-binding CsgD family transcriptional regulator